MKTKLYILFTVILVTGLVGTSCEGPMGPEGPEGPQGPPGQVGPAGDNGSIIHAGNGAPGRDIGNPGDLYLDLSAGALYGPKDAIDNWGPPVSLVGADGKDGNDGEPGPQGPEGPQGPPGEDGEDGKDGKNGEDGEDGKDGEDGEDGEDGKDGKDGEDGQDGKDGEDGQDGIDGEDGSQIFAGDGPPAAGLGRTGDYYLDKTAYDLYGPKTAGGWGTPINLQGPQGDPGPAGPPGTDGATDHGVLTGLGDDDHLQYLLVNGVRDATNGFAVTGTVGDGVIPFEGPGTRMMWYPGKGAFRAGRVTGTDWNDSSVGLFSVALGWQTTASGLRSTAIGGSTQANGTESTAIGSNTVAGGRYSTAMGRSSTASGESSIAMGFGTAASGYASTSFGFTTRASGNSSTAIGQDTWAAGISATTMGQGTHAFTTNSLTIGKFNDLNRSPLDDVLLVAGNGTSNNTADRSDALVLDFDGDLWIAGTLTEASDRRLKTNIQPLGMDLLGKLGEINPVRYRFKEGTGHPEDEQIGLIAQEVQAHFPELVSEKNDGTLSLSYSKFAAVLLKGLQEQQAEIERLQAEVRRINRLETQLAGLQAARQQISPYPAIPSKASGLGVLVLLLFAAGFLFRRQAGF